MGVENASYIQELDPDAPLGTESISEGDNHLRVIKSALKKSFPEINSEVTATPDDLNAVSQMRTDLSGALSDLNTIKSKPNGNVASCYYKGGSRLYEYNVSDVTKTPGNNFGTRITFRSALQGPTPSHYSFSITPVAGASGRPIVITVTNVTQTHIDFIAIDLIALNGDWSFVEGATVDFSLVVIDMEAGQ